MKKILIVIGTRPEAIKCAPLILELKKRKDEFDTTVLSTGQHSDMLIQALKTFDLAPDHDLKLMKKNQSLTYMTTAILEAMTTYLEENQFDIVLSQGDTTTVMATSIAAFYTKTVFAHLESGLRTNKIYSPFPEEFNRKICALAAKYNFCPTKEAVANLIKENIPVNGVYLTGNTVIDALLYVINNTECPKLPVKKNRPYIFMTCHRRENFGPPLLRIIKAIKTFAKKHPEIDIWYPVHKNPNIKTHVYEHLDGMDNIILTDTIDYQTACHGMNNSIFIITDSGGIQEEAPSLGKPVIVIREDTERPEGVKSRNCLLTGTGTKNILADMEKLLNDKEFYEKMSKAKNPYGDGTSSKQIADIFSRPYTTL